MTEVERILDQYDRAMHGDAWHGEPIWQILEGISAEQAAHRPHAQRHTIWEIVAHMAFWETEVHRRINKLPPRSLENLNFPAMPAPTELHWKVTLDQLRRSNADFRNTLSQFDPSRLDEVPPGRNKSIYVDLHGVIQHHLYHLGQIVILRSFAGKSRG
jgi:hypothetical protein